LIENSTHKVKIIIKFKVITNLAIYNEEEPEFPMIGLCFEKGSLILTNYSFLIHCQFDSVKCTFEDFEYYTDGLLNECILFNSGRIYSNQQVAIKNITRIGLNYGLTVWLYIENYKHDIGPYKISLYIQNHSSIFDRLQAYERDYGIFIPPGITNIQIEREFIQNLPEPYNPCIIEAKTDYISNLFQQFNQSNKVYSQKDCIEMCVKTHIMIYCNCTALDEKTCLTNETLKECATNLYFKFQTKSIELPAYCLSNCSLECNFINYNTIKDSISLTDQYLVAINRTDLKNLTENLIFLSINYKSKQYTLINQLPKTQPFDVVNSFGSLLGLFIGFSFLSLVEILDISIKMIIHFFKRNRDVQIN